MSQAALPTKPAAGRPRLSIILTSIVAPVAIVALAGGPKALGYWGAQLSHMRLHAPNVALLARVGRSHPVILLHLGAAVTALLIGIVLLIGVKGTLAHKTLGYGWVAAMATTAVSSLWIKTLNPGHWSFIHFLSGWTIIALPLAIAMIKRRQVRMHARMMTGLFVGGLGIAGLFAFLPGRLMWTVFFG